MSTSNEYSGTLVLFFGVVKNLNIKFDTMKFDELRSIYTAKNNIIINDLNRELIIKTKQATYDDINKILNMVDKL